VLIFASGIKHGEHIVRETVTITLAISDETGSGHDIDSSGNPAVVLINNVGTDRSTRLSAWQHPATGKYTAAYTNSVGDAIDNLYWEVTAILTAQCQPSKHYESVHHYLPS
jgi:hypothetical protein